MLPASSCQHALTRPKVLTDAGGNLDVCWGCTSVPCVHDGPKVAVHPAAK